MLVGFGVQHPSTAPHMIIQRIEIWRLKYQRGYFKSESQFSYLFTLKNAHLSSISYNFGTQAIIAMKFTDYVVGILLLQLC